MIRHTIAYLLCIIAAVAIFMGVIKSLQTFAIDQGGVSTQASPLEQLKAKYPHTGKLPATVDLTRWAPRTASQGQVGSCVSWAVVHSMLGWYSKKSGESLTFAPMYVYAQTHIDKSKTGGGSTAQDTLALLSTKGVPEQADYPQGVTNFTTKPTPAQNKLAKHHRIRGYTELYVTPHGGAGKQAETAIKTVLASGNPVGLSIPIEKGFKYLSSKHHTWDGDDSTRKQIRRLPVHYVAVFGYDKQGVWIQNSWGKDWGKHGYARLTWHFINSVSSQAEAIDGFVK